MDPQRSPFPLKSVANRATERPRHADEKDERSTTRGSGADASALVAQTASVRAPAEYDAMANAAVVLRICEPARMWRERPASTNHLVDADKTVAPFTVSSPQPEMSVAWRLWVSLRATAAAPAPAPAPSPSAPTHLSPASS